MALQRFARWWSVGAFVASLAVLAATYASAHAEGRLPKHHPWPAISVASMAFVPLTLSGHQKNWLWGYKIAVSAFSVVLAIVVSQIT